ncbi:MAG: sensor histidine kinase [Bacteroidales bacterium]
MISTVLLNLITNAIKFTPQNGTVEIQTFTRDHEVEVMVADSGVGISPKNLERLFRLDEKSKAMERKKKKVPGLA